MTTATKDLIPDPNVDPIVDPVSVPTPDLVSDPIPEQTPDSVRDPILEPIPEPTSEPRTSITRNNEKSGNGVAHEIPAANSTNENSWQQAEQIEEYNFTTEDHASRAHILYSLPNLESLPRHSSSMVSYLSVSQRKLCFNNSKSTPEDGEIQSRMRTTEKRIADLPIQLQNRFQILQRGRQGPLSTKSL